MKLTANSIGYVVALLPLALGAVVVMYYSPARIPIHDGTQAAIDETLNNLATERACAKAVEIALKKQKDATP